MLKETVLKAIETRYNGHRFRSRTEARWAVLFDHLGVKYEYEAEGFELGEGIRYLPDFYMPVEDCYFEIKGEAPGDEDLAKIGALAIASGKWVNILIGQPGRHEMWCVRSRKDKPPGFDEWADAGPTEQAKALARLAARKHFPGGFYVQSTKHDGTFCALGHCDITKRLAVHRTRVDAYPSAKPWRDHETGAWTQAYEMEVACNVTPMGLNWWEDDHVGPVFDAMGSHADWLEVLQHPFLAAIEAAKSARFEFGESGAG